MENLLMTFLLKEITLNFGNIGVVHANVGQKVTYLTPS
jgi:hypothetical protein